MFQSLDWDHGVLVGSSVASEKTAAAEGKTGELRFDPFAMLPFCGYNMGDYFQHWLDIGKKTSPDKLPKIFHVNWFRKESGKFIWPGFGDNIRVLKWIFERLEGKTSSQLTPIGYIPSIHELDTTGLTITSNELQQLLKVDPQAYLQEVNHVRKYHSQFGNRLPHQLKMELNHLEERLSTATIEQVLPENQKEEAANNA